MQLTASILLLLPLLPFPAQEKEIWQRLYTWETSTVDISTSNVVFGSHFTGRVRLRLTLSKPEPMRGQLEGNYKSVIETIEFKCGERQYRKVKVERFDRKANLVDTEQADSTTEWKDVKRKSMMEKFLQPACEVIHEKRRNP